MRATVDEKLHATLEQRLGESFKQVADRLEQVHRGLGEMQTLARDVGSLNRVLTNVKTRGMLRRGAARRRCSSRCSRPSSTRRNVETEPGSDARVEFAIRLPGRRDDGAPLWLPIDCKFPRDDYERLLDAQERADRAGVEAAAQGDRERLRAEARTIRGQVHRAAAHDRLRDPVRADRRPVRRGAAPARPGRGAAARTPRDAGRPDHAAGHAEQPADGLSHAGAGEALAPRSGRCSARSRPSSASSATCWRRPRRSSTRPASTIEHAEVRTRAMARKLRVGRGAAGRARAGCCCRAAPSDEGRAGADEPPADEDPSRMHGRGSSRAPLLRADRRPDLPAFVHGRGAAWPRRCWRCARATPAWAVGVLLGVVRRRADRCSALPAGRLADRHGYHRPMRIAVGADGVGGAAPWLATWRRRGPASPLCAPPRWTGAGANIGLIAIQRSAGRGARDATDLKRVFSWLGLAPAIVERGRAGDGGHADRPGGFRGRLRARCCCCRWAALWWARRVPRRAAAAAAHRPARRGSLGPARRPALRAAAAGQLAAVVELGRARVRGADPRPRARLQRVGDRARARRRSRIAVTAVRLVIPR